MAKPIVIPNPAVHSKPAGENELFFEYRFPGLTNGKGEALSGIIKLTELYNGQGLVTLLNVKQDVLVVIQAENGQILFEKEDQA